MAQAAMTWASMYPVCAEFPSGGTGRAQAWLSQGEGPVDGSFLPSSST